MVGKMVEKVLLDSLRNHKTITIIYMKESGIIQRRIQVIKIEDRYIRALDKDKNSFRTFKISNILSAR